MKFNPSANFLGFHLKWKHTSLASPLLLIFNPPETSHFGQKNGTLYCAIFVGDKKIVCQVFVLTISVVDTTKDEMGVHKLGPFQVFDWEVLITKTGSDTSIE